MAANRYNIKYHKWRKLSHQALYEYIPEGQGDDIEEENSGLVLWDSGQVVSVIWVYHVGSAEVSEPRKQCYNLRKVCYQPANSSRTCVKNIQLTGSANTSF